MFDSDRGLVVVCGVDELAWIGVDHHLPFAFGHNFELCAQRVDGDINEASCIKHLRQSFAVLRFAVYGFTTLRAGGVTAFTRLR